MAEYGIPTPETIVVGWTPAQILVALDHLGERQARQQADRLELAYLAAAASRGGRKGQQAVERTAKALRKRAGQTEKQDPDSVIHELQKMGIQVERE
jgi:hypothetical protein